jgi:hypothetical protein
VSLSETGSLRATLVITGRMDRRALGGSGSFSHRLRVCRGRSRGRCWFFHDGGARGQGDGKRENGSKNNKFFHSWSCSFKDKSVQVALPIVFPTKIFQSASVTGRPGAFPASELSRVMGHAEARASEWKRATRFNRRCSILTFSASTVAACLRGFAFSRRADGANADGVSFRGG